MLWRIFLPVISALFYVLRICSNDFFLPKRKRRLQLNSREFSSPPCGHDGGFRARSSDKLTGGKFN